MLRTLCIVGCLLATITDQAAAHSVDFREAIRSAVPATVSIRIESDRMDETVVQPRVFRHGNLPDHAGNPIDQWIASQLDVTDHSLRAGFAVAPDLIVTINVPPGTKNVEVLGVQGSSTGHVVLRDHVTGLAAIRVEDGEFPSIPIGVEPPEPGLAVVISWLRGGTAPTSNSAMIASGPGTVAASLGFTHELDANLSPMVAGAPVLDSSGVMVGVVAVPRGPERPINHLVCLPAESVTRLVEAASESEPKDLERGLVGIQFGDTEDGGAIVQSVIDESPAAAADIQPGDLIVRVNDHEIKTHWTVVAAVAQSRAGDDVKVLVQRDGEMLEQTVKLAAQAEQYVAHPHPGDSLQRRMFGMRDGRLVPLQKFDGEWSLEDFQKMFGDNHPDRNKIVPFTVPQPKQLESFRVERSQLEKAIRELEANKKLQDQKIRELTENIEALREDAQQRQTDRVNKLIEEIRERIKTQGGDGEEK